MLDIFDIFAGDEELCLAMINGEPTIFLVVKDFYLFIVFRLLLPR